jgi:phosphatidylserine/phosphatidylglycerophosphate/cardiolipin synthase-like enzyme
MSIDLKVYDNGDHTCLVWLPADGKPIPGCRGFTIRRIHNGQEDYLHGFVGFSDTDRLDPANPWKFPVQRFLWWDYFVKPGDTVQYSVVPVTGPDKDHLTRATALASPLTGEMKISGQCTPNLSAYFNKGIVASQWVSRALNQEPKGKKIKDVVAQAGDPLRNALSGLLRPQILSLLADAKKDNGKIFAALYELNDPELIPALEAFGSDCSVVLANGAFSAQKPDENADVRQRLRHESKVNVFDRMVSEGHFAHNKFVVFCDSAGKPQRVLTGSTNWTTSGLCTQANNGLIINDPAVAADFLAAWKRIQAAGNGYPAALVTPNSAATTFEVDGCKVTPWFVKTSAAQDLDFARKLINAAKEGILFLFFNPGTYQTDPHKWTLLQNILNRHQQANNPDFNPDLYIRGVVNQDIPQLTKAGAAKGQTPPDGVIDPAAPKPVTLFTNGAPQGLGHDVLVPHNIKDQFSQWEKELLGASMVNIHSKVIVLDPFGENPVVMTGSHNLGFKASNANDDNLVIIEGNAPLAAAYAINIIAIFQTYRWNSYVEMHRKDPKVWHGLVDNDQWQAGYLTGDDFAELNFWLGGKAAATPAGGPAAGPAAKAPAPPAAAKRHVAHTVATRSHAAPK